jgi:serine/threonine protein kinase
MDYVSNGSLAEINKRVYGEKYAGPVPPAWGPTAVSKAIIGIAAGMAFIHSLGLIHRALCPEHILLDENWEVRITGFRTARPNGWASHDDRAKSRRFSIFDSPEFSRSDNLHTEWGDVYSYAICLYSLFTAPTTLAWGGPGSKYELERAVRQGYHLRPSPQIPPFIWDLIQTLWRSDEGRSFKDILSDFRRDRRWILEGSDAAAVAEYEHRVCDPLLFAGVDFDWTPIGLTAATEGEEFTSRPWQGKPLILLLASEENLMFPSNRMDGLRLVGILKQMSHPATVSLIGW